MYKKKYTEKDLYLLNKYLNKFMIKVNDSNIVCMFKTKNYNITIYKNKTLLITGKNYDNILKMIDKDYSKNNEKLENIIGSDEVGTGDTFGGIVVCACYIEPQNIDYIKSLNVDDSKKIDNKKIIELFIHLKDKVIFEVINLEPKEYNELYEKYNNLNILKTYGHHFAIKNLIEKNKIKIFNCVIDQFTPLNKYKEYLKKINEIPNGKEITIIQAESKYLQVAVASIIARYYFIKQIEELSKKINFIIPFGSANNKIFPAINWFKTNKQNLNCFAKTHFKTIKNNT